MKREQSGSSYGSVRKKYQCAVMGHFHFSRESKWTWFYKEILCIYPRADTGFDELQHTMRINVSSHGTNSLTNLQSPYLIKRRKWRDRRKNLIQPLSLFISTSSTASHYLRVDRPQTNFHHRRTCKSLANEADIFCNDSMFPSPWLRNSALHSADFSGKKKSVIPLNAINIAFILLWPGSQLHDCLQVFFAHNARNKSFINLVFYCCYVSSGRGKHGDSAWSSIWPATISLWSMELACFIFESTGRIMTKYGIGQHTKSCRWNLNLARTGYLRPLLRCVYSVKRPK